MRKQSGKKTWVNIGTAMALAFGLASVGPVSAQGEQKTSEPLSVVSGEQAPTETSAVPETSVGQESDQVESIQERFPFKLEKEKDPFKPLVVKPDPRPPDREPLKIIKVATGTQVIQPKPIPPLKLFIQGVCGNDAERLAMIVYENQFRVLKKDEEVKDVFKVVDILSDKVVVYSIKEQMRRSFPIGGGKE